MDPFLQDDLLQILVGGNSLKPEFSFLFAIAQGCPIFRGCFEHRVRPYDIGLDEIAGAVDGAVHMTFCSQAQKRIGLMHSEQFIHGPAVADVRLNKSVSREFFNASKIFQAAGNE